MFNETTFRRHAEETLALSARLKQVRRLFKTEGGHLTNAGRAIVAEGLKQGMTTADLAELLEVNPAVVRYHARQLGHALQGELRLRPARRDPAQPQRLLQAS
ncbi:hypothetical protein [Devosia sp. 1566]|uniref:hypothetical protein n=1 Tax=Devosia sp. 1566 TaxID=2499144 RepID=UPI000FDA27FD|nr:hypothetical protein [Devosia sp. 1566]